MADISELILEVKNANSAVHEIDKVDKKLKQTTKSANELKTIGKTLFAGWSFTKLIGAAKAFGDAWRNTLITTRKFDAVFGSFNRNAQAGVKELTEKFHETERGAKDLIATIGSRLDFGFDPGTLGKVSADLARISKELSSFYGRNVTDVSLKLTQALAGQTRGLKEYGINIDINSAKFKQLAKSIQESTNETEEGARALAVYTSILGKVREKEGAFETQAKTISQLLEDIKNSFVDGPLAQAGQILSTLFGPLLSAINSIIQSPLGTFFGGLILVLTEVTASIKLFKVALIGLSQLTGAGGILAKIGPNLKEYSQKIINALTLFKWKTLKHDVTFGIILQRIGKNTIIGFSRFFLSIGALATSGLGKLFGVINASFGSLMFKLSTSLAMQAAKATALIGGAAVAGMGLALKALGIIIVATVILIVDQFFGGKLLKTIINWLGKFFERLGRALINLFKGQEVRWETEAEAMERMLKNYRERTKLIHEKISSLNEQAQEALNEFFDSKKVYLPKNVDELIKTNRKKIDSLETTIENLKKERDDLDKWQEGYNKWLEENRHLVELGNTRYKYLVDDVLAGKEIMLDMNDEVGQAVQAAADARYTENKLLQKTNENTQAIKKATDARKKLLDETTRYEGVSLESKNKLFENYVWYKDSLEKIQSTLRDIAPRENVESIQQKIDKFKQLYSNILLSPDEAREKYKALADLEISKYEKEMETLNKEREFIQETNEMIKNYVDQALQWKAQGVEGIQAGTAEGYKFITSGFSNLSNLGPILKEQESSQKSLQEKANSLAEKSTKLLEGIKTKIDSIDPNAGRINFELVNK